MMQVHSTSESIELSSVRHSTAPGKNEDSKKKPFRRPLEAWRSTVLTGVFSATSILIVNILTLVIVKAKYPVENQTIAFYTGKCKVAGRLTTFAQLLINILSSVLLAAGNFSMQCLSSPTRKDIDLAHSKSIWLDIGTPSLRNLFFIPRPKALLWLLLAISSVPLHLIWNSAVSYVQTENRWLMILATEDFARGANWSISQYDTVDYAIPEARDEFPQFIQEIQGKLQKNSLESLSLRSCYDTFQQSLISDRKYALLIANISSSNSSVLGIWAPYFTTNVNLAFSLLYSSDHTFEETQARYLPVENASLLREYQSFNPPLSRCYSQIVPEKCKASIIPVFLIVVIISNTIKIIGFILALYLTRDEAPLCTTGDAVQSFLNIPDSYTQGRCLAASKDYEKSKPLPAYSEWDTFPPNKGDIWTGGREYWFSAIRRRQVLLFTAVLFATIFAFGGWVAYYAIYAPNGYKWQTPPPGFFSLICPNVSRAIWYQFEKDSHFLARILMMNSPQILISYVYLGLNNIMTAMLVQAEWCGFSTESQQPPKGLRVSSPIASTEQRSTYFLSLPYRWSIPAITITTLVHWLVSETFHIVQLDSIFGSHTIRTISLIISPILVWGIVIPVIFGSYVLLLALGLLKRYPGGIPLAGGCSASIAAACQPSRIQESGGSSSFLSNLACMKLQWGVVDDPDEAADGIGHATFSAGFVQPLKEGALYN